MRTSKVFCLTLGFLWLSGCAGLSSSNLAPNTINEPVFHHSPDLAISGSATLTVDPEFDWRSSEGPPFATHLRAEFPVNDWASFSLLPVYWNFLLTGDQYEDSIHLRTGHLHLALSGGISGFGYSSENGLTFPGSAALHAKYIFDETFFASTRFGTGISDISNHRSGQHSFGIDLGAQLTDEISVIASSSFDRYFTLPHRFFDIHGVLFTDGDVANTSSLSLDMYPSPKHILSISGMHFLRIDPKVRATRWIFTGQYTYVFGGH